MMAYRKSIQACLLAAVLSLVAMPSVAQDGAQDNEALTTTDDLRAEVSEAMEAIAEYSAQERDQALTKARETLKQLDAEIERREHALRENWADMSKAAKHTARERLRDLRRARNALGERYGALQAGTSSAWDELKSGFYNAWDAFSEAWSAADEAPKNN
ncbi:MAG: hypothetical protein U5S82_14515 [Gammaproteobacteria bacterium]|nr:hypothetical protein [Gammaproteobacteria bacterium]